MRHTAFTRLLAILTLTSLLGACANTATTDSGQPRPTRSAATIVDDQVIESRALDTLYSDPALKGKIHINVISYNHIVLLTGEALSREARTHAIDVVRNLPKVRRVHNEIRIQDLTGFQSRTQDGWITSKIKTQMLTTPGFSSDSVKVITEQGRVFLMGLVTRAEGHQAAEIARHIKGVQQVIKLFEYAD